ncbi:MAG: hypothetical protein H8E62_03675 [Planctomycetes bacterium]|nr:hypothetical protein [Planctomycetota bacterium]
MRPELTPEQAEKVKMNYLKRKSPAMALWLRDRRAEREQQLKQTQKPLDLERARQQMQASAEHRRKADHNPLGQ